MTRIADGVRTVSWTVTKSIAIGYHDCEGCGVETPAPPDSEIIDYMRTNGGCSTLWPGEHWMPTGWGRNSLRVLLCPECVTAVDAALAARKGKKKS